MTALLSHQKIRSMIAEHNLRQEPFAESIGISDRHVRNLCKRDTDVAVSLLYRISAAYHVPMLELLVIKTDDEEQAPQ